MMARAGCRLPTDRALLLLCADTGMEMPQVGTGSCVRRHARVTYAPEHRTDTVSGLHQGVNLFANIGSFGHVIRSNRKAIEENIESKRLRCTYYSYLTTVSCESITENMRRLHKFNLN